MCLRLEPLVEAFHFKKISASDEETCSFITGKVLPQWVIYNIIHTHARTRAVSFTEAAPLPSRSSCPPSRAGAGQNGRRRRPVGRLPSSAEKSGRTKPLEGAGAQPGMLRDFLESGHCENLVVLGGFLFFFCFLLPPCPGSQFEQASLSQGAYRKRTPGFIM